VYLYELLDVGQLLIVRCVEVWIHRHLLETFCCEHCGDCDVKETSIGKYELSIGRYSSECDQSDDNVSGYS